MHREFNFFRKINNPDTLNISLPKSDKDVVLFNCSFFRDWWLSALTSYIFWNWFCSFAAWIVKGQIRVGNLKRKKERKKKKEKETAIKVDQINKIGFAQASQCASQYSPRSQFLVDEILWTVHKKTYKMSPAYVSAAFPVFHWLFSVFQDIYD